MRGGDVAAARAVDDLRRLTAMNHARPQRRGTSRASTTASTRDSRTARRSRRSCSNWRKSSKAQRLTPPPATATTTSRPARPPGRDHRCPATGPAAHNAPAEAPTTSHTSPGHSLTNANNTPTPPAGHIRALTARSGLKPHEARSKQGPASWLWKSGSAVTSRRSSSSNPSTLRTHLSGASLRHSFARRSCPSR